MMKSFILLIAFFYVNVAFSQFTYTADQHHFIGQEVENEITNLVPPDLDFALTGEDYSWDYSEIALTRKDTLNFLDPSETGYQTSYCLINFFIFNCQEKFDELSNIALRSADSIGFGDIRAENIIRHFQLDEDSYSETMLGVSAVLSGVPLPAGFEFEEPDVYLRFPFTYESEDSSSSRLVIDLSAIGIPVGFSRDRKRVNFVEGYGQLTTPAGSYNSVLKMKTLIYNTDTTIVDTIAIGIPSVEVEYKWFAKGYSGEVLSARGIVVGDEEVIVEVIYRQDAEISPVSNIDLKKELTIFPNPFTSQFQISSEEVISRIEIYDMMGAKVYSAQVDGEVVEANLQAGTYILFAKGKSGDLRKRIISL